MTGERFSGFEPERALPKPDRVNLDIVTGYLEGVAGVLKGEALNTAVRNGLISLIREDLR